MRFKFNPIYHSAIVSNWRRIANLPDSANDAQIYQIVCEADLTHSNSLSNEEKQEEIDFLREKLELL